MPEPAAKPISSLKQALNKLKIGGGGSNPVSDDESSNTPRRSNSRGRGSASGAQSPGGVKSPDGAKSPPGRESPRNSGIFPRSSGTFSRSSIGSHSPIRAVRERLHLASDSESEDYPLDRDGEPLSRNQLKKHEKQAQEEIRKKEREEREQEIEKRRKDMEERAMLHEPPEIRARYGARPVNDYAKQWKHSQRTDIAALTSSDDGKDVLFRARIHHLRKMSAKLVFLVLRQGTVTIQGVLTQSEKVSEFFVYWAEHLDVESVVLVGGTVQKPKAEQGKITGTTIHDAEILVSSLHVEGKVTEILPFSVNEAEIPLPNGEHDDGRVRVSDRTRLANRVIDLRTTVSQGVFRVQSGVCNLFRSYLDTQGFFEIHTPKLQGGATESGASVFKIDYFGRPAFLAQSPQLAKQMCIAADFGRVYEIGAVFRAENSNTHRHLTEYTGLDIEMAIDEHYHEVLKVLDGTFKHIFKGLYEKYRHEIDVVKTQFPHEDLKWLDETLVLNFKDAVTLLNESGWRDEDGKELPVDEDLGTRDEIQLGKVIKEKYGTDYYVIDKFPASARPFYAMNDPDDDKWTNSFDIFVRGQEILSGGQRIHDSETLLKKMDGLKVDRSSMEEYVQGFEWGAPPHGGGGIGLERIVMLILNLGDIRHASLYPRDPKSLPEKPVIKKLRHPEASTMHPPWEGSDRVTAHMDFQPLEKLIANYGDATNTSWLEPRIELWRDGYTGAAVGFSQQDNYAIIPGDPLCHSSQYTKTATAFLKYITKQRRLKPIWLLVNADMEDILANRFNWRTFSVVAEQRLDPSKNAAIHDGDLQRKIRHAEKEGVKIHDYSIGTEIPDEVKQKIDKRVEDWVKGRKGRQVHLTNIRPWQDMEHRQYHYSVDANGEICALLVMAQLSPDHGWQVKYSLDFPGAPSGAIEQIVTHGLKQVAVKGASSVTFGAGASAKFTPGHNLKKTRVKVLSKAYHAIVNELKLTNKSEFREKLGAEPEPVYLCYPPHGMGPHAVKSILNFFEEEE